MQIWCFFTLLVGFLILFRIEGTITLHFLSLFLAMGFLFSGGASREGDPLFPKEDLVIDTYIGKPLQGSWQEQRKELNKGWESYLIDVWAKETPSSDSALYRKQVSKGLFFFNLKRVHHLMTDPEYGKLLIPSYLPTSLLGVLFVLWNGIACFSVWLTHTKRAHT